jgi:DNA-directed RNA polymerase subunit M/transcription elongation factor TFIIS
MTHPLLAEYLGAAGTHAQFENDSDYSWETVTNLVSQLDGDTDRLLLTTQPKSDSFSLLRTPEEVLGHLSRDAGMTCPRCNKKEVTYTVKALRSGDEGMIPDCECRACGYRFRLKN